MARPFFVAAISLAAIASLLAVPAPAAPPTDSPRSSPFPRVRVATVPAVSDAGTAPGDAGAALSLTRCDFDGDGAADAIAGQAGGGGNRLSIFRGNADAIWPDTPEARDRRAAGRAVASPFLPDPLWLEAGPRPDLLGCGQIDGDGHADLVVAQLGSVTVEILFGDGRGGVGRRARISLPAPATALAVGEANRPDGLDEIVVGAGSGPSGRLLIFEDPRGAERATPEVQSAAGEVRAIALGRFDADWMPDVAFAAGPEVRLVHGRDRRLSLDDRRRLSVPDATGEALAMGTEIVDLVGFDPERDGSLQLAVLTVGGDLLRVDARAGAPARVPLAIARLPRGARLLAAASSGGRGDDLFALDRDGRSILALTADLLAGVDAADELVASILELDAPPVAALPFRLGVDGLDDLVVLTAGEPRLAAVIFSPLNVFVVDTVVSVPEQGCSSWYDRDETPGDGVCESLGGGCTFMAAGHEAGATAGADLITFQVQPPSGDFWDCDGIAADPGEGALTLDGSQVPGLWLRNVHFQETGCVLHGVEVLDLQVNGEGHDALIEASNVTAATITTSNNQLGGTTAAARNVLHGIELDGPAVGNVIEGNWIGTEDGVTAAGGAVSIGGYVAITGTRIGGTAAGTANLISGGGGIHLGPFATGTLVQGNLIGTDVTGSLALGNTSGVEVRAPGNTIGGTAAAARNVFGAGDVGIRVFDTGGVPEILVQGNFIGTDASGTSALGFDTAGIEIYSASDVVVGGTSAGAGNLVAGNSASSLEGAIWVRGASSADNSILGNRLGTGPTGTTALGNRRGIRVVEAEDTWIGGTSGVAAGGPCTGACNLIAASAVEGIYVGTGATGTVIEGNYVGTDVTGTAALGNGTGIWLSGADFTRIGGTSGTDPDGPCAGACNLIAASLGNGIVLASDAASCTIEGNFVGTNVTGLDALGNASNGISISASPGTTIGGDSPYAGNLIAASGQYGIRLSGAATTGTIVRRNRIGLGADGETPLGNAYSGIVLTTSAGANNIGGLDPDQGNDIAHSSWSGIRAESTAGHGNAFLSNRIRDSVFPAIDIGAAGIDGNDPGDGDDGANGLQNYPVLTGVTFTPLGIRFDGNLDSTPSTLFTIQFFANEICGWGGHGEARWLLGTRQVTTASDGYVAFEVELVGAVALGQQFTATATDPDGNTSELSACLAGPSGPDVRLIKVAPATAVPGGEIEFQLEVVNVGSQLAQSVAASDTLDGCLSQIVCATDRGSCALVGSTATATIGDLPPLESALVTITARIGASCPDDLVNSASASAAGDVNPHNDADSSATQLVAIFHDGFESGDTNGWSFATP